MLTKDEAITAINELGSRETKFSFYCDFLGEFWEISKEAESSLFHLEINSQTEPGPTSNWKEIEFTRYPYPFKEFKVPFEKVLSEINYGNSFLTNLTFQTPIHTNLSLEEIFNRSEAKYRLWVPEKFVVFSPETFIQIKENFIYSYPMKGTIDASIPDAAEHIKNDIKEKAEHVTIVDLIRNDLSQVATDVQVTNFRFLDTIKTNKKELLQVSSEIKGLLDPNWKAELGNIITKLLPAGSISGAPKPETIRIIQENENYERGFYTGICGRFDGQSLDTGVMIRFIKQEDDQLYYCSGGGITSFSDAQKEYQEMVDKIYLPFQ